MKQEILYSLKSPYRQPLDVIGFRFGSGRSTLAVVGATRGEGKIISDNEILIVPCINYYSMNIGKRFWTMDNTDINRMFPGYSLGETTQRIADGVFTKLQGFEYGILRTPKPYDTTTLNYNWQIWETNSFSVYTGETDNIDEKSADEAITAILRFMSESGIISCKTPCGYNTEIVDENITFQVHCKTGGIFRPQAQTGDLMEKGELLGEIISPLDCEVLERIYSRETGIIYFSYDRPLINENTVCWKIIRTEG